MTNEQNSLDVAGQVEHIVMPENLIIRKWHKDNGKYEQCNLRELWENGFFNGQIFQAHNHNLARSEDISLEGFYVNSNFFDEKWKAFWSDLNGVEIVIIDA